MSGAARRRPENSCRRGDLASLTGRKVALNDELIKFRPRKTGRDMVIPITPPFLAYLKKHFPQDLDAPIFICEE